jgi:hypothetical protein
MQSDDPCYPDLFRLNGNVPRRSKLNMTADLDRGNEHSPAEQGNSGIYRRPL